MHTGHADLAVARNMDSVLRPPLSFSHSQRQLMKQGQLKKKMEPSMVQPNENRARSGQRRHKPTEAEALISQRGGPTRFQNPDHGKNISLLAAL